MNFLSAVIQAKEVGDQPQRKEEDKEITVEEEEVLKRTMNFLSGVMQAKEAGDQTTEEEGDKEVTVEEEDIIVEGTRIQWSGKSSKPSYILQSTVELQ